MADTPKKTRTTATKTATAAKPRKPATKKAANGAIAKPAAANGHVLEMERAAPHDEVARLAHTYWQQRGQQHGQHIEDWFRAEQELRGKAS